MHMPTDAELCRLAGRAWHRLVTVEHPPMFTVEQSRRFEARRCPARTPKICSSTTRTGSIALVVAKDDTRVDLKRVAKASRLRAA